MGFDAIPEDREQSFPCEVCNGNIKLSAISGVWECEECGCLPGSKPVLGHRICCLVGCNKNAWKGISDYCEAHALEKAEQDEPCENCHLAPVNCEGLTLKDACVKISELKKALTQIASQPLEPAYIYEIADRIKLIAKAALEI